MSVIKITPQIITKTKLPSNYHLDVHSNPFQSYCYFRLPLWARQFNAGSPRGVYLNLSPLPCATIISEIYLSEHSVRALISRALLNTYNTYSLKFDQNRRSKHVVSIMGKNWTKVRRIRTELTLSFNLLMSLTLLYKNHFNQPYIHFIVASPFNSLLNMFGHQLHTSSWDAAGLGVIHARN